jgi:hypothetical protein
MGEARNKIYALNILSTMKVPLPVVLCLAFLITSVCATFLASDAGEKLKNMWTDVWCGDVPNMPIMDGTLAPMPETLTCRDRVTDAASSMISVGMSVATVYAAVWTWQTMTRSNNVRILNNNISAWM